MRKKLLSLNTLIISWQSGIPHRTRTLSPLAKLASGHSWKTHPRLSNQRKCCFLNSTKPLPFHSMETMASALAQPVYLLMCYICVCGETYQITD